jgi:hypothetical protein
VKTTSFVTSLLAASAFATPVLAQTAPKPKLIVAISVDQLSTDLFNEYRATFTGGLKRLSSGIVFPRGHQSHAATETCPGHSTILTGGRPSRTGIIANDWQNPSLERKTKDGKPTFEVYCAEKPGAVGSDAANQEISTNFLRIPTLGDRMKAVTPATRVVAVSGKDRAAVMMGGKTADTTIWWNGKAFGTYAAPNACRDQCARDCRDRQAADSKAAHGMCQPFARCTRVNHRNRRYAQASQGRQCQHLAVDA